MSAEVVFFSEVLAKSTDPVAVVLKLCQAGREALTQARTLADGNLLWRQMEIMADVVQAMNLSQQAVVEASAIRVRAERRVGELIRQERGRGRLAAQGDNRYTLQPVDVPGGNVIPPATLADHGINRKEAAELSRLADTPPEKFEAALADLEEQAKRRNVSVTRSGVLRAVNPEREKRPDERWLEADRFFDLCRRLARWDLESVAAAIRFGVYPGDEPLVSEAPRLLLDRARAVLADIEGELRRKGL